MYSCSWLTNNIQCNNITDYLVCELCYLESSKLYNKYKQKEKTVLSALSSAPRGDILEVSKVLGRLSEVVSLRQEFTSRLSPQVRDTGHKYHISKLLTTMSEYRQYLHTIISDVQDDTPEETTNMQQYIQQEEAVTAQITTIVETDPFAQYDTVIEAYKADQQTRQTLLDNMDKKLELRSSQSLYVISFYVCLQACAYKCLNLLSSIFSGRMITFSYRSSDYKFRMDELSFAAERLEYITRDARQWILQHACLRWTFNVVKQYKQIIIFGTCGTSVYPIVHQISIRSKDGKMDTSIEPVYGDIDELRMNYVKYLSESKEYKESLKHK